MRAGRRWPSTCSRGGSEDAVSGHHSAGFGLLNVAKLIPFAGLGIFTRETLLFGLVMAPFALLGAWIGVRAHRVVPERAFFAITYGLLTVTGTKLIWDALT